MCGRVVYYVVGLCNVCYAGVLWCMAVYCAVGWLLCGRDVQCVVGWCTMW